MILEEEDYEDYLAHYGILRKSGRYPWGSGRTQSSRNRSFLQTIQEMRDQGLSDDDIRKGFDIKSQEWRDAKSYARAEQKASQITQAEALRAKGMSNVAAAKRMGIPESSYRSLLADGTKDRNNVLLATSNMLKEEVDSKKFIDVGTGVENYLGISQEKLRASVSVLRQQGYELHTVPIKQVGTNKDTKTLVLCPPGTTQKDAFVNRFQLRQISQVSNDGGRNYLDTAKLPIVSISPDRVAFKFKEDGGDKEDGMIYVRRGVEDVSLGKASYSQVRIQVGDSHYLKGMAMYKDDLPPGKDLLFCTAKERKDNNQDNMKELNRTPDGKVDPDLPFGAVTTPLSERTGRPLLRGSNDKVVSAMNIVNTEGQWHDWSRNISAQALSKQAPSLAREQLKKTYEARKAEYDEIMSLTNPVVRKKLLETFADSTDSSAVHLKAAALDRQNWRVILPLDKLKPSEIYAPTFNDGERVALIRYPHGGTFEIPELTVNNRNAQGKKLLGEVRDAVGIHHSVAERLSGADFDGDTVLVIPNDRGRIKSTSMLEGLKGFDAKTLYRLPDDAPRLSPDRKQQMMGDVSNLITDMTIKGAPHSEIVRAVRHSMVVIDAEKHHLNYSESARREGISDLKRKYQNSAKGGAATLISRAGSPKWVDDRELRKASQGGPIDPATGKKVYVDTGRLNAKGGLKKIKSKKLAEEDDAFNLISDKETLVEKHYAEHSNRLKALANRARLDLLKTPSHTHIPSSKRVYADEVRTLASKLNIAQRNAPLERQAQVIAAAMIKAKVDANPQIKEDRDLMKKIRYQAQEDARARMGAAKQQIVIEPKEWEAIQAGAITHSMLEDIVRHSDLQRLRELATPHPERSMTTAKTARAMRLLANGATRAEVARQLGVSVSTLDAATMGDDKDDDE